MQRYPALLLGLTLVASLCLELPAQEPGAAQGDPGEAIRTVVHNNRNLAAYQQTVLGNAQAYEAGLSTQCRTVALDWSKSQAFLTRPGRMLPDGNADGTQWVEKVPGEACGQHRDYRVTVLLQDGKGRILSMLPGDGWAGPLLEHDTMLQVNAAAGVYTHAHCAVDVLNTTMTGKQPAGGAKTTWTELWTVQSCGKKFGVPITFVPDAVGDGTSMSVDASKLIALP